MLSMSELSIPEDFVSLTKTVTKYIRQQTFDVDENRLYETKALRSL